MSPFDSYYSLPQGQYGTFEMAQEMALMRAFTYITKPYSVEQWTEFRNNHQTCLSFTILTCSNGNGKFEYICDIMKAAPEITMIHVNFDKTKGSYDDYIKMIEHIRRTFPNKGVLTGFVNSSEKQEQNTFSRGPQANPLPYQYAVPTELPREENLNIDTNRGKKLFCLLLIYSLH